MANAPIPELTQTQQAQLDAAAEKFRRNAIAQGISVVGPDGTLIKPKRPRLVNGAGVVTPLPTVITLDVDQQPERTLVIKDRAGQTHEIHVQPVPVEMASAVDWYRVRSQSIAKEVQAAEDEDTMLRLNAELQRMQEKLFRLSMPDLPDGLLGKLSLPAFNQLMQTVERMISEALGDSSDPLGYTRLVYQSKGSPNGNGNQGLLAWLMETLPEPEPADPNAQRPA